GVEQGAGIDRVPGDDVAAGWHGVSAFSVRGLGEGLRAANRMAGLPGLVTCRSQPSGSVTQVTVASSSAAYRTASGPGHHSRAGPLTRPGGLAAPQPSSAPFARASPISSGVRARLTGGQLPSPVIHRPLKGKTPPPAAN